MTIWLQANLHLARADEAALTQHVFPIFTESGAPWFFIHKHPFRIRWTPTEPDTDASRIQAALDALTPEIITRWNRAIYEPETEAFGGPVATEAAHAFFHAESQHFATALEERDFATNRGTYSILLVAHLMRSAGLDWWEQGDVWARLTTMRSTRTDPSPEWRQQLAALINRDPWQQPVRRLETHRLWFEAAARLGSSLADLASSGRTTRGLRALIAHHVIFHWNRVGLAATRQALLSAAARTAIFGTVNEEHQ